MGMYQKILFKCVYFLSVLSAMPQSAQAAKGCEFYCVKNIVSNLPCVVPCPDPFLLNPWGLVINPKGDLVVANNHSNRATSYKENGRFIDFKVRVDSFPTGLQINTAPTSFIIGSGVNARPASLLFATEEGNILAYNGEVDQHSAIVVGHGFRGTIYKGMDIYNNDPTHNIYAPNFNDGFIDQYNREFDLVHRFRRRPVELAVPYNLRVINGLLYVSYLKKGPNGEIEQGPGNGFIDVYAPSGDVVKRPLIDEEHLNSPWGLALAPKNFGKFSGALLVGNNGDGRISAYNIETGAFLGQLTNRNGFPIEIDGLRALEFLPNRIENDRCPQKGPREAVLYFSSGPNGTDGILGMIHVERN